MTKERLIEVLNSICAVNTSIAHKQGVKCNAENKRLDRLHQEIAKAMGFDLTKDDLDKAATL